MDQPIKVNSRVFGVREVKSGVTQAGKPWTLWVITDTENRSYATFNVTDQQVALDCLANNMETTFEYVVTERGLKLDKIYPAVQPGGAAAGTGEPPIPEPPAEEELYHGEEVPF